MTTTTHYNYNIVEGTDIVNPLVQTNPNFTAIDGDIWNATIRTCSPATETKTGTVHNIVRSNTNASLFSFTSTSSWTEGDSMTIEGSPATVVLPSGDSPSTNVYVSGVRVIGYLYGGTITLFLTNKYLPAASEIATTAGDSVQDELDSMGSVITVFEEGAYAPGDTWVLSQDVIDYMDTHKAFLLEAQIYYGATYNTSRTTQLIARGFGRQVTCAMNRNDIQVGVIKIDSTTFEAFGYDEAHTPHIRNLYMIPLGTN